MMSNGNKIKTLIGLNIDDFDQLIRDQTIKCRPARLIPLINPGKEEALTSIFLSSITLIDEFRSDIFEAIGLKNTKVQSNIRVYTEVVFPTEKDKAESRLDGLILIIRGNKIIDAAVLEMKNKNDKLDEAQIKRYLEVAKALKIPKLITVSNEFVSEPNQSPLINVKVPNGVELRHLSWQFIRTLARIRLFGGGENIEDIDQVHIMKEVVAYLEHDKSGVIGFSQMKSGWNAIAEMVRTQRTIQSGSPELADTVDSWIQEERDMALKLSCDLGTLVKTDNRKFRGDLQKRVNHDIDEFQKNKTLSSSLEVDGLASAIMIKANFDLRTVEMSVTLDPMQAKTLKGQLGWVQRQIENREFQKKDDAEQKAILENLSIELNFKSTRGRHRCEYSALDSLNDDEGMRQKRISKVSVIYHEVFGRKFSAPKSFVERIEQMLPKFYKDIAQHLTNWVAPAPRMPQENKRIKEPQPYTPEGVFSSTFPKPPPTSEG